MKCQRAPTATSLGPLAALDGRCRRRPPDGNGKPRFRGPRIQGVRVSNPIHMLPLLPPGRTRVACPMALEGFRRRDDHGVWAAWVDAQTTAIYTCRSKTYAGIGFIEARHPSSPHLSLTRGPWAFQASKPRRTLTGSTRHPNVQGEKGWAGLTSCARTLRRPRPKGRGESVGGRDPTFS